MQFVFTQLNYPIYIDVGAKHSLWLQQAVYGKQTIYVTKKTLRMHNHQKARRPNLENEPKNREI